MPEEVLWRQKEQFSDGVGYDWVDGLKNYSEAIISDAELLSGTRGSQRRPLKPRSIIS